MIEQVLLGAGVAVLLAILNRRRPVKTQFLLWGQALIIAALIYVCFNLFGKAWSLLWVELLGLVIYTAFALLAWRHHLAWLGVGWLLHVAWDLLVHPLEGAAYVPDWYPGACLGFDLVVGAYLLMLLRRSSCRSAISD